MNDDLTLQEQLSAYLDDELDPAERAEVERKLQSDPKAQALLNELQTLTSHVHLLPKATASPEFLTSTMARLEREALLGQSSETPRHSARPWLIAASLLLAAGTTYYFASKIREQRTASFVVADNERVAVNSKMQLDAPTKRLLDSVGYTTTPKSAVPLPAAPRSSIAGPRPDSNSPAYEKMVANAVPLQPRAATAPLAGWVAPRTSEQMTLTVPNEQSRSNLVMRIRELAVPPIAPGGGRGAPPSSAQSDMPGRLMEAEDSDSNENPVVFSVEPKDLPALQGQIARLAKDSGAQILVSAARVPPPAKKGTDIFRFDVRAKSDESAANRGESRSEGAFRRAAVAPVTSAPALPRVLLTVQFRTAAATSKPVTSQGATSAP